MRLDVRSSFERDMYFRCCEPETYRFVRSVLRPGMTFVDAGANLGFYTLLAATLVGPSGAVYSYEPTPETFERLASNVRLNGRTNVTLHHAALADRAGIGRLWEMRRSNHGMNTLINGYGDGRDLGPVTTATIDESLSASGARRVDLMKLDVEGAELAVVRGASRTLADARPVLIIELSPPTMAPFGYSPEDLVDLLVSTYEYQVFWPDRGELRRVMPGRELPHYALYGRGHGSNYVFRARAT